MDYKICRDLKCKKIKTIDEFYVGRAICKDCFKDKINKKYQNENKEKGNKKYNLNDKINMLILKIDTIDNKINEFINDIEEKPKKDHDLIINSYIIIKNIIIDLYKENFRFIFKCPTKI